MVASTVGFILLARHHHGSAEMSFESGYQFEMVLTNPVTLNVDKVNAALASSQSQ
jgi:hypothetical protein